MSRSKWITGSLSIAVLALSGANPAKAQNYYQHQNATAAGKAILACPARATAANPNFAILDISTGIESNSRWMVRTPTVGPVGDAVTPSAIPGNWVPDTATSGWITTPAAATANPPLGTYSYWLDFGIAPCPRSYICTVSINAKAAADDLGAIRITANPSNVAAIAINPASMTAVQQSWPGLSAYHTINVSVHNASVGETGFHLSGVLKRQCL